MSHLACHRRRYANGFRGELDLWLPAAHAAAPLVVLIHGGGLQAYDTRRMNGVARRLAEEGFVVANINYRLLQDAAYPAALEDVLAAVEWARRAPEPLLHETQRERVILIGASAGAFLASVAGMMLGRAGVAGIVAISGPSFDYPPVQRAPRRPGAEARLLRTPVELASAQSPPLLAIHSRQDTVVNVEHSRRLVDSVCAAGGMAELFLFDSAARDHGIWVDAAAEAPELLESLRAVTVGFARRVLAE